MSKIEFQKVSNAASPLFVAMCELYQTAFPAVERRSLQALKQNFELEKRFLVVAFLHNGEFAGFFNYWLFANFVYVEHFAVDSNLRGQHIGSKAMQMFLQMHNCPIVFEVEMPENHIATRRIAFYERLNCKLLSKQYAQPPYDGAGEFLPMLLMTNNYNYADKHFAEIKTTLYSEVYKYSEV